MDINYDLVPGITKLLMDIGPHTNSSIKVHFIGLENYKTHYKYDMITYSPPPFNTKPYSGNSEFQSYNKYPTFEEYFGKFLVEIVYKAKDRILTGGLFAFTALDRDSSIFKFKHEDKYRSSNIELIYVEALLLLISAFGFKYYGAIGVSVGDKPAQVPWWSFIYTQDDESVKSSITCYELLRNYYPKLFNIFNTRLLHSINNQSIYESNIEQHDKLSSKFETNILKFKLPVIINSNNDKNRYMIIYEIIRYQIQNYITSMIATLTGVRLDKVKTYLGRYLMLRSIIGTFEQPYLSGLYVDPLFPVIVDKNLNEIEKQLVSYFGTDGGDIVFNNIYQLGSYYCKGVSKLYETAAHYVQSLPYSNLDIKYTKENVQGNVVYRIKTTGFDNIVGYANDEYKFYSYNDNILSTIRYETLGASPHQYTRVSSRIKILEKIFNQSVIDIYASDLNNNSEYYCSIYPDVERKSLGSAFTLKMLSGAFMANPVDVKVFVDMAVLHVENDILRANKNNKHLMIGMSFTLWLDTNVRFVEKFEETEDVVKLLKSTDNNGVTNLAYNEHLKVVYILDSSKHQSLTHNKKVLPPGTRNSISLGLILSTKELHSTKDIIDLVKNEKHYKIIKKKII